METPLVHGRSQRDGQSLQALVIFQIEDEDRRRRGLDLAALGGRVAGPSVAPDEIEDPVDLTLVGADHEGRVAPPEEPAGTREPGGTELILEERVDDVIGVFVLDHGNDEFLH